jgi:hypothetical protein
VLVASADPTHACKIALTFQVSLAISYLGTTRERVMSPAILLFF